MIAHGRRVLREQCGLSVVQWRIIALVAGSSGAVTSANLTNAIEMDPGQFSRNLKALIDSGLIESKIDKTDNRQQVLTLSRLGKARFNKVEPIMKKRRESLMRGISVADREAFFRAIDQLENNLKTEINDKSHA